jgi:hypothetical protein
MPGHVPGIHVLGGITKKDVDGRDKPAMTGGEEAAATARRAGQ